LVRYGLALPNLKTHAKAYAQPIEALQKLAVMSLHGAIANQYKSMHCRHLVAEQGGYPTTCHKGFSLT
jgi:hypothetical protein